LADLINILLFDLLRGSLVYLLSNSFADLLNAALVVLENLLLPDILCGSFIDFLSGPFTAPWNGSRVDLICS
jgi:hypothetical protein